MALFGSFRKGKTMSGSEAQAELVEPTPASDNQRAVASYFIWSLARPPISVAPAMTLSTMPDDVEDSDLVSRVQAAYRSAVNTFESSESFWDTTIGEIRKPIHQALIGAELATNILRDPSANTHFWGFDAVCKAPDGQTEPHELVMRNMQSESDWKTLYSKWLHDALVSLAEAVGSHRLFYPETTPGYHYERFGEPSDINRLLDGIEEVIGRPIRFPNPYPGEFGMDSSRGVVGFRSLQAIYQAWRLVQLSDGRSDYRVIEIGAGLGRTAHSAIQFGLTDYTIIDIPLTNAAQAYFLGRTLGPDKLSMFWETAKRVVRVLPPHSLRGMTETFDILLNVDSFTELSESVALGYWTFARSNADALLSINHELNQQPVRSMYKADSSVRVARHPYWMRRGYVEEHITWAHRKPRTAGEVLP